MATSTFTRPLVLTEQGVDNLIALIKEWEKNPPPPVQPMPEESVKVSDELLQQLFRSNS